MKFRNLIFLLVAVATLSFMGCNDEVVEHPASKYTDALNELYPDATDITWERENPYMVAEFMNNGQYMWTYFNHKADWQWTQYEISYESLPTLVKTAFADSEYESYEIIDILCITTPSLTYYQFELTSFPLNVIISIDSSGDFI